MIVHDSGWCADSYKSGQLWSINSCVTSNTASSAWCCLVHSNALSRSGVIHGRAHIRQLVLADCSYYHIYHSPWTKRLVLELCIVSTLIPPEYIFTIDKYTWSMIDHGYNSQWLTSMCTHHSPIRNHAWTISNLSRTLPFLVGWNGAYQCLSPITTITNHDQTRWIYHSHYQDHHCSPSSLALTIPENHHRQSLPWPGARPPARCMPPLRTPPWWAHRPDVVPPRASRWLRSWWEHRWLHSDEEPWLVPAGWLTEVN